MSSTPATARSDDSDSAERAVNNFSIQVATVNGSGSQTANLVLLRSILLMGGRVRQEHVPLEHCRPGPPGTPSERTAEGTAYSGPS